MAIAGRVRPVAKGVYDSTQAYIAADIVTSADGRASYYAQKDVPAGTPLTNAIYWQKLVDCKIVTQHDGKLTLTFR